MPKLRRGQWVWLAVLAVALILAQIGQPHPNVAPFHHIPTLVLLVAAPWLLKRWPVSDAALGCIVIFFLLHTLGGRYTYSNVPYAEWWRALTGGELAQTRNHYDRLVHLAFGVLAVLPAVEFARLNGTSLRGGLWAALGIVLGISALYEIFEWLLTVVAAGPIAEDYNGQQGDIWDAQKDMMLALLGTLLGIAIVFLRSRPKSR